MTTKVVSKAKGTKVEALWAEYARLNRQDKKKLAERIMCDAELLEDFLDKVLIEEAKRMRGKPITLEALKALKRKSG